MFSEGKCDKQSLAFSQQRAYHINLISNKSKSTDLTLISRLKRKITLAKAFVFGTFLKHRLCIYSSSLNLRFFYSFSSFCRLKRSIPISRWVILIKNRLSEQYEVKKGEPITSQFEYAITDFEPDILSGPKIFSFEVFLF